MSLPSRASRERNLLILVRVGALGQEVSEALARRQVGAELSGNATVLMLCDLALRGPLRPRDLQRATGLTSGGTTRQLDHLERLGLIERSFGKVKGDRRAIEVSLTEAGARVADLMADALDERIARLRAVMEEVGALLAE